jgi:HlyD family secretion protein
MTKLKNFAFKHKVISAFIILVVIFIGYEIINRINGSGTTTRYVLAAVKKGTLITSITGTGQVAATNQVDIKPEVTGNISYVGVVVGQTVQAGQLIAQINNSAALRSVNNAKLSLANAKLSYQKALKADQDQSVGAETSDLDKAYHNGYQAVANTFVDLSNIITDLNDVLNNTSHSPYFDDMTLRSSVGETAQQYKNQAKTDFYQTKMDYRNNFKAYQAVTVDSDSTAIIALLNQTEQTVQDLSAAANGTYSAINYVNERLDNPKPGEIAVDKTALSADIGKIGAHLTAITNAIAAIETAKDTTFSVNLSLESAKLSVSQAESSLADAQKTLADHSLRAPFAGVIAEVPIKLGDLVSLGTVIATIITKQQVAEISLNEVDAAKVAIGQKATLTFDAIDGLRITGKVVFVDLLGTVSQGVVTYQVKISLDAENTQVKSGMSTSAEIVTAVKPEVLLVPNGAVKTKGGVNYVEIPAAPNKQLAALTNLPWPVSVKIGLANDTSTEIISGLNEGDQVISRTITAGVAATTQAAPSLFGGGRNLGR